MQYVYVLHVYDRVYNIFSLKPCHFEIEQPVTNITGENIPEWKISIKKKPVCRYLCSAAGFGFVLLYLYNSYIKVCL